MKLSDYLKLHAIAPGDFADQIGVNGRESVRRYLSGDRIPAARVMRNIVAVTDGAVQPNDFFGVRLVADDRLSKAE